MSVNEEFFSSIETEWQIESGNFKEEWTKLDLTDIEPKLEKEWILHSILIFIQSNFLKKYGFLIIKKLDFRKILAHPEKQFEMPEISHDSSTFKDDQIMMVNNLLPARCIGAKWNLKYSTRKHGTSIKTLYRQVFETDGPNLCVIKVMVDNFCLPSIADGLSEDHILSGYSL